MPPPILGLGTGLAMWLITMGFPEFRLDLPLIRIVGLIIMVLGLAIDVISIAAFVRARTSLTPLTPEKASQLVVSGLYKYSRNPMYLGLLVLLTGWGLHLSHPVAFLLLPVFVIYITIFQIKPEEKALQRKFGAAYESYCQKVRRWI